jgi:TonB-dependent receptor
MNRFQARVSLYGLVFLLILTGCPGLIYASTTGTIIGTIQDKSTGEALPSANIVVKGTSYGAVSDLQGKYRILRVPTGNVVLRVTYIGYKPAEIPVTVKQDETVSKEIKLEFDANKLKYNVTVTAQQEGQAAAINQQIRANTIVNVVSKDKIQELPDQNASESLGRLPGIAIQRSAGEGQKVVVRGLSPRFSSVTVNGERLPAVTDDRSVDLSMISPDVLEGIEVYKALRPDIDGDAIGGSINFITKKAPEGAHTTVRALGGYNQLSDDYGNYKASISYSNRFFRNDQGKNRLGIVATGSVQRANRQSDLLNGSYYWTGMVDNKQVYETSSIQLNNHLEIRHRYSLNLAMDYNLGVNHEIIFSSLWGRTDRDVQNQIHNYDVANGQHIRRYTEAEPSLDIWTNSLMGNHVFGKIELNWRASYSQTNEKTPWDTIFDFEEDSAFSPNMPVKSVSPQLLPTYALNDAVAAFMNWTVLQNSEVKDRNMTALIDLKYPFLLPGNINGNVKVGGKIRNTKRSKDVSQWGGNRWYVPVPINLAYRGWYSEARNHKGDIALANFIRTDKKALEKFLKGDFTFNELLDLDKLHWFASHFDTVYYKTPHPEMDANDYNAGETISASYIMAEFNWKDKITFMPGFRYEWTETDYASKMLSPLQSEGGKRLAPAFNDTLGNRNYGDLLPMMQLRIKPVHWFDIRLASTQSITRPDFFSLIPYELVQWDLMTLQYGNSNLKETKAKNYDAYVSFYNRFGLLSVGTFYKKVNNIDYVRTTPKQGGYYAPFLTNLKGWTVTTPENLKHESTVKGWEFELQTNLKFLPSPLDGIVLYANFSKIQSQTEYPYVSFKTQYIMKPPYVVTTVTDTARVGRMVGQADEIANLTLGYEKAGFSGRLSLIYQGNSLQYVAQAPENDGLDDSFLRWDLVMQQKLYKSLKVIAQVNNITDQEEKSYIRYQKYLTRRERYGRTVDLGLQFEF